MSSIDNRDELIQQLQSENTKYYQAVLKHWNQKGDDRCILDDDELYAAFGLPTCDRACPIEMLESCRRFIAQRTSGTAPTLDNMTIRQLEDEVMRLRKENEELKRWKNGDHW